MTDFHPPVDLAIYPIPPGRIFAHPPGRTIPEGFSRLGEPLKAGPDLLPWDGEHIQFIIKD